MTGPLQRHETTVKKEGRKLVTACSTQKRVAGHRVRHDAASGATLCKGVSWGEYAESDETALFLSLCI